MPTNHRYKWEAYVEHVCGQFSIDRPQVVAIDTETTGFEWSDRPFGMTVAWHANGHTRSGWFELGNDHCLDRASWFLDDLTDRGALQVYYNAKFDIRMLVNEGLLEDTPENFTDMMAAVANLYPSGLGPQGLKNLKVAMAELLGVHTHEDKIRIRVRDQLKIPAKAGYHVYPRWVMVPYALKDAVGTLALHDMLPAKIEAEGLQYAFDQDMALCRELILAERTGVKVDIERAKAEIIRCDAYISKAEVSIEEATGLPVGDGKKTERVPTGEYYKNGNEKFKTVPIPEFNPNSGPQKIAYFKTQGIRLKDTRKKTLESLDHPLVPYLIGLGQEERLRNTYLVPLVKNTDENGIYHPNLNQWGTRTGRFSSGKVKGSS